MCWCTVFASIYLQSPSSAQLRLFLLPLNPQARMFHKFAPACDCCLPPDSYAAMCFVLCDAIKDSSNSISRDFVSRVRCSARAGCRITEHESSNASLLRPFRVSKGDQSFSTGLGGDSGRGCLCTAYCVASIVACRVSGVRVA